MGRPFGGGPVFCARMGHLKLPVFDAPHSQAFAGEELPRGTFAPTTYEVGGTQYVIVLVPGGAWLGKPACRCRRGR